MREVTIDPLPLERLAQLLSTERADRFRETAEHARVLLAGRTVWNMSSTSQGGGVAEMLQALLAYGRGAAVDTRWLVLLGDPEFFAITKRVHNLLHASRAPGVELGPAEVEHYRAVTRANEESIEGLVRPGDIVLLHDPQTAGLVEPLRRRGAHVAWRCHVGSGLVTPETDAAWGFLRPFIEPAEAFIFSRPQYAPPWLPAPRVRIIAPSIDPFSTKNEPMGLQDVGATLRRAGLVDVPGSGGSLEFGRRAGATGTVRRHGGLVDGGAPVPGDVRVVLQLSRWDRLKDMTGVLAGFATYLDDLPPDVHLVLAGPEVTGVSDDPEGADVLASCRALWQHLPARAHERTHLVCLPMDDVDENAHLANALQRHADVVVQKSLAEGFGLTVTEPMWKAKPVVASRVGGIQDQIEDGVSGVLLQDPADLGSLVTSVAHLFDDPDRATALGVGAHERVRERFLGDRHLTQFVHLFDELLGVGTAPGSITSESPAEGAP